MENDKKKHSTLYKYGRLDEYTGKLISGEFKNTNVSIAQLQLARDCSRQDILEQEGLCPPRLRSGGMYRTLACQDIPNVCVTWDSFDGMPPVYGEFGPRKGRKARMRDQIHKNLKYAA